MRRFMLDTDICVYTIKNRPAVVRGAFSRYSGQLCVSAVTAMELMFGAAKSSAPARTQEQVEGFLARLDVMDYDAGAASNTAELRGELGRSGTPIGPYDVMIAGHARALGLVLVTNNEREFQRVPGLRLENWAVEPAQG